MDHQLFLEECTSCGLPIPQVIRGDEPDFCCELTTAETKLVALLIAAHGKPPTDAAVINLRDHLGVDSAEWAAYRDTVTNRIRKERAERYRTEADPLRYAALEKEKSGQDASAEWKLWLEKKEKIRTDLPYPQ